jgi:hypothetical protein
MEQLAQHHYLHFLDEWFYHFISFSLRANSSQTRVARTLRLATECMRLWLLGHSLAASENVGV